MEVKNVKVQSVQTGTRSFGQGDNAAHMRQFWSDSRNAVLYPLGELLAITVAGQTLAQHLVDGQPLSFPEGLQASNGVILPVEPGFTMTMKNLADTWGCPACHSAHGSAAGVSRKGTDDVPNPSKLAQNLFFYNPSTKRIFTISTTCYREYVKKTGQDKRIVEVPAAKALAPVNAAKVKA